MMTFFTEINDNERDKSSTTEPAPVPASPDLTVGPLLKARRLELGLKYKDISKDIKIKTEYLKAIEEEEFDLLPTPEYLRLFLKTYAVHLGFDPQEIYSIYDTQEMPVRRPEKKEVPKEPTKEQLPPSPPSRVNIKAIVWISVAAVVVLLVLVVLLFGSGDKEPEKAATPRRAEPAETDIATRIDSAIDTVAPPTAETMPAMPLTSGYRLQIWAVDSIWMEIQASDDSGSSMLFTGIFNPGETDWWNAESSFIITLGKLEGVEASINGRFLKPFTEWGTRVRKREVGGFNLNQYLDSTRLDENGSNSPYLEDRDSP